MKPILLYFLGIACLFMSCQDKSESIISNNGFLVIKYIDLQQVKTEILTRAIDPTLTVDLWKGENKIRTLTTEEMQDKIELEPAEDYCLKIYSANYGTEANWTNENKGEAIYYKEQPFTVKTNEITGLNIKVPMVTFAVSIDLSSIEQATWLQEYSFTVSSNNRTITLKNGETAYFIHQNAETFNYSLSITNTDGETNQSNSVWGDTENETINPNTLYTVVYNVENNQLIVK